MNFETKAYLAGAGTAAFILTAGFGGGVFLAGTLDTRTATPAPGMSRIERSKREEPKPPVVETTAQAPREEPPAINPLAEARPLVDRPVQVNAELAAPVEAVKPEASQAIAIKPPVLAQDVALPAAIQSISSPRGKRQDVRRLRSMEQAQAPGEPRIRDIRKPKKEIVRRNDPDIGTREVARYREGAVRYVVRTENGRPANPAEVDQLKRELRERREGRVVETRALSYGPERRGVFGQIFRD